MRGKAFVLVLAAMPSCGGDHPADPAPQVETPTALQLVVPGLGVDRRPVSVAGQCDRVHSGHGAGSPPFRRLKVPSSNETGRLTDAGTSKLPAHFPEDPFFRSFRRAS